VVDVEDALDRHRHLLLARWVLVLLLGLVLVVLVALLAVPPVALLSALARLPGLELRGARLLTGLPVAARLLDSALRRCARELSHRWRCARRRSLHGHRTWVGCDLLDGHVALRLGGRGLHGQRLLDVARFQDLLRLAARRRLRLLWFLVAAGFVRAVVVALVALVLDVEDAPLGVERRRVAGQVLLLGPWRLALPSAAPASPLPPEPPPAFALSLLTTLATLATGLTAALSVGRLNGDPRVARLGRIVLCGGTLTFCAHHHFLAFLTS
jgi:hypothetical protein